MKESFFFKDNHNFVLFGFEHILAILAFAIFGYILINWAKTVSKEKQFKIGNIFAYSMSITIVFWTFLKIYNRGFDIKHDLPFHLCNFIALLLPVLTITRKKIYYEILLFWIFAGTSQAIITPDIKNGFPHFHFLKYWIIHAGLIVFILYITHIYNMRPTLKSVFKSFLALQAYFILMLIINKITGANYFYINRKPEGASILDYLGDWPYYILVGEIILLPYFLIIYLPFYLTRKRIKN